MTVRGSSAPVPFGALLFFAAPVLRAAFELLEAVDAFALELPRFALEDLLLLGALFASV
jgi:hypothetical protein